jgi:hypothetical protein
MSLIWFYNQTNRRLSTVFTKELVKYLKLRSNCSINNTIYKLYLNLNILSIFVNKIYYEIKKVSKFIHLFQNFIQLKAFNCINSKNDVKFVVSIYFWMYSNAFITALSGTASAKTGTYGANSRTLVVKLDAS